MSARFWTWPGDGPAGPDPAAVLHGTVARDRGRLISALIRELRDFQLAEDALQDALEAALQHWRRGQPADRAPGCCGSPGARRSTASAATRAGATANPTLPRWPQPIRPPRPNRRPISPMTGCG
ncbi:MAG: hypothetical protein R3D84_13920 [Paracoccaceae bacterium]